MKFKKAIVLVFVLFLFVRYFHSLHHLDRKQSVPKINSKIAAKQHQEEFQNVSINKNPQLAKALNGKYPKDGLNPICYTNLLKNQKMPLNSIEKFMSYLGPSTLGAKDYILHLMIKEKRCPNNMYTIVKAHYDDEKKKWSTDKEVDCIDSTMEEQIVHGIPKQGSVYEFGSAKENEFSIAINGDGYFHLKCENEDFLSRSGSFHKNQFGVLVNELGCTLQDEEQNTMMPESLDVGENGCFAESKCIKVVPHSQLLEFENIEVLPHYGLVKFMTNKKLKTVTGVQIISNSAEDLSESTLYSNAKFSDHEDWEFPSENIDCNLSIKY
jgi:hypothetical protein